MFVAFLLLVKSCSLSFSLFCSGPRCREAVAAMLDRTKSIGEKLVHWLGGIEAHVMTVMTVMTVMRYHVMTEELGPTGLPHCPANIGRDPNCSNMKPNCL